MVGWHHWLNGHEFEQAPGDGEGQGSLACCSQWGHKDSDTTELLNKNRHEIQEKIMSSDVKKAVIQIPSPPYLWVVTLWASLPLLEYQTYWISKTKRSTPHMSFLCFLVDRIISKEKGHLKLRLWAIVSFWASKTQRLAIKSLSYLCL